MKVAEESVVTMHYTLTSDTGEVLDSSSGSEPLEYLQGFGNVIPGLEAALLGKAQGDKFKVSISPDQAYGERNEKLIQRIPKDQFPDPAKLKSGMQFQINGPNGPMILNVMEVTETEVVVDGNPELAGQNLNFEIEVTGVRAATPEELEHGHVHGPGGHHHHD